MTCEREGRYLGAMRKKYPRNRVVLTPIVINDSSVPSTLVSKTACLVCTATVIAAPSWHIENCRKQSFQTVSARKGEELTILISATQYFDLVRTAAR